MASSHVRVRGVPPAVRRFSVASEPWTIENGVLTPSMKVKRHVLRERYGETLEGLY